MLVSAVQRGEDPQMDHFILNTKNDMITPTTPNPANRIPVTSQKMRNTPS